ncbi:MAG: tetratricopeptide repeat protein [Candidatus Aminicenantes bacterium]|nr:MAG: tetratricopeptide repeat protein [Candidatus Aminicenantes bacterium]
MNLIRHRRFPRCAAALSAVVLAACGGAPTETVTAAATEPLFAGTGPHRRPVAASSADAQAYFDQGLAFLFAFNHDEAIRSFRRAVEIDPNCAMAWWGIAYANGPHINNAVVPPQREAAGFEAANRAASLAEGLDEGADRALILAVTTRYASPQPEDRAQLDAAYAAAMADVYASYPDDGDVGALYAESLLDLHPWDLWEHDGSPKEWTPPIVALLEDVMARHPEHPLALHLYIHTVEASDDPARGDEAADRLRNLMPGLGHMVHMPSHIDVLRGRWEEAIIANTKAIEADAAYREAALVPPDFYRLYMSHNHHMKAYAAMMVGRSEVAMTSIRQLVDEIPEDWLRENTLWADGFIAMPYEVMMRFGRWQEILDEPEPADYIPFTRSMHHAARAVALAALDRPEEARVEQLAFLELRTTVPEEAFFGNNMADDLLGVADRLVEGEILYREGARQAGIEVLYEAAALEDALNYDEPPDWIQPIRHALGATLLQERRYVDAERVYREDLERLPDNGWSLYGLARALRLQGKSDQAAAVESRFDAVWEGADTALRSSCFCQPGV